MLIRSAGIDAGIFDLRIDGGRVGAIGPSLPVNADETVIDAGGAALLPGLHDHHLHLVSLAAALSSVPCGPPQVESAEQLATALRTAAADAAAANQWIRGIGYHSSIMGSSVVGDSVMGSSVVGDASTGEIDRDWLDRQVTTHPLRIQHRGGRLWIFNSRALECLGVTDAGDDPCERIDGRLSGRLYDADDWLRLRLGSERPGLRQASRLLAGFGVTGATDTTPDNDLQAYGFFADARRRGDLLQDLLVMGDGALDAAVDQAGIRRGARKFHLHESRLPDFDELCGEIRRSHAAGRAAAFHCVTRSELVFALAAVREAALREGGAFDGDRIEHAGVTPPEALDEIAALGLTVVTQPNFIAERGDAYLRDVAADDQPWLYRLKSFLDAGVALAGSTDAPFGAANPWPAMQAAVARRSSLGHRLGPAEALTPEQALALFTCAPDAPGRGLRRIEPGMPADLCLLSAPWRQARVDLAAVQVRLTLKAGKVIFERETVTVT